jgi:hypothetical protein
MTIFESTLNNERTMNCSEGITEVMQPSRGGTWRWCFAGCHSGFNRKRMAHFAKLAFTGYGKHLGRKAASFNPA